MITIFGFNAGWVCFGAEAKEPPVIIPALIINDLSAIDCL
jgi:hypothetical protein